MTGAIYVLSLFDQINSTLINSIENGYSDARILIQETTQSLHQAKIISAFVAVIVILSGAALVIYVINRAFSNFFIIREAMEKVGHGDLTQNINIDSKDELGELARDFNTMVNRLSEYQHELDDVATHFRSINDAVEEVIITTDPNGNILSWNKSAIDTFGYRQAEAIGKNISIILPKSLRTDHHEYIKNYFHKGSTGRVIGAGPRELHGVRKDGIQIPIDVSITEMFIEDKLIFLGIIRDISERKASEEEVAFLTQYDKLTNLPNRSLLYEKLLEGMERASRGERLLAVLQIDLDRFIMINESLGHDIGDKLLISFAERVSDCMHPGDYLARTSSNEFCIVIENMQHVLEASVFSEKLMEVIDEPFLIEGHDIYITISIGISIYPFDEDSPDQLIRHANTAMKECKEKGGNTFSYYSDDMNSSNIERVKLIVDLKNALDKNQFVLYFQPQIDLKTGVPVGAEALIRWKHHELGLIPPGQFIGLLEETGLIIPVGEWAIREGCRQNSQWHKLGYEKFRIGINLSVKQFRDKKLVGVMNGILEETGMDPELFQPLLSSRSSIPQGCLELELTEGLLMENTSTSCGILNSFKEMGIKISIDDFGTGYSSLSYLKQFPLDTLKIDQSFVRDIGKGVDSELIIQAIIDLSHNLQLDVIAEGVETELQLKFLLEKGCDQIQGYYIGKPMPVDEMTKWLENWDTENYLVKTENLKTNS